jgi:hypothetical protein
MSGWVYSASVVLCAGWGLVADWSTVQGVLPTVYRIRAKQYHLSVLVASRQTDTMIHSMLLDSMSARK